MPTERFTILHVDMDAFYASVEQRDRPELRGKPVVVGGSAEGRGVVSAASYEAREYGVHSAMPAITARRLCPQAVFLPPRIRYYGQISRQLREIFHSYTPLVEPLSLDEAFLDVHGCEALFGTASEIAAKVKARIKQETGLTASVGVAANKFLAKLASDLRKPDGLVVIPPDQVRAMLDPLPVGRIWGVGAKAVKRLQAIGIHTIGDVIQRPQQVLIDHLGQAGGHIWQLAWGRDGRDVTPDENARSLSTETTFAHDIRNRDAVRGWFLELVQQLGQRIRLAGVRARTVDIKVRTSDFRTYTRSKTLPEATDLTEEVWQTVAELFEKRVPDDWFPVRLVGVGVSGLVRQGSAQECFFDKEWREKQRALDDATDAIRKRFGADAIGRAGGKRPSE